MRNPNAQDVTKLILEGYKLNEAKQFTIKDVKQDSSPGYPYITEYRVGKTGVRFTAVYYIVDNSEDKDFRLECHIQIKTDGTITSKLEVAKYEDYQVSDIADPDNFVNKAIEYAVQEGYIEEKDGIYVDKKETEKAQAKSDFLNIVNLSDEEIKSTLPGKNVKGLNSNHTWNILGIFKAYNGKEYVAMKKNGSFADPNIVELNRFKSSYKILD